MSRTIQSVVLKGCVVAWGVVASVSVTARASGPDDNWWDGLGTPPAGKGLNSLIYTMTEYDGKLVVGGAFTQAGNNMCANRIARWGGSGWGGFSCGMDSFVHTLLTFGQDLYAGGAFLSAGGIPVKYVARWDGASWDGVGTDLNDHVQTLAVFDGDMIAGGWFDTADGSPANRVAVWDGAAWQPLGQGIEGDPSAKVSALVEFQGDLYAGGAFTQAGGNAVTDVARWDGANWDGFGATLTPGGNGWVVGVEVLSTEYNGNLIVGGNFSHVNGLYVNGLAEWNGSTWTALGVGLSSDAGILDVTVYNGDLIAWGYFTEPGGGEMVARWNGVAWTGFGSGCETCGAFGGPGATIVYENDLYVGGNMCIAGGKGSLFMGRWIDPATEAQGMTFAPRGTDLYPGRPSPFRDRTTIPFAVSSTGSVQLSIYDASGRRIVVLADGHYEPGNYSASWSGHDERGRVLAPGVYFARLTSSSSRSASQTQKVVLVR